MGSRRRAGSAIGTRGELRVNVGCGQSPTPGYVNFDNSLSLALPGMTSVASILIKLKLIDQQQASMSHVGRRHGIRRAEATRLPLPDHSAAVLYSSHMIEHLSRGQALEFLLEARRGPRPPGGPRPRGAARPRPGRGDPGAGGGGP